MASAARFQPVNAELLVAHHHGVVHVVEQGRQVGRARAEDFAQQLVGRGLPGRASRTAVSPATPRKSPATMLPARPSQERGAPVVCTRVKLSVARLARATPRAYQ